MQGDSLLMVEDAHTVSIALDQTKLLEEVEVPLLPVELMLLPIAFALLLLMYRCCSLC